MLFLAVADERDGWQAMLAGHGAQPRPCLAGLCWLARLAARRDRIVLCSHGGGRARLSRGARRTVLTVSLDSRQTVLQYPCQTVLWRRRSRRTILWWPPDCLDSPTRHPQDCLAMPSPDCLAAAVARLDDGSGDRALGRRRR
jgi:hypothetical protein